MITVYDDAQRSIQPDKDRQYSSPATTETALAPLARMDRQDSQKHSRKLTKDCSAGRLDDLDLWCSRLGCR
jgi:hypothetical protein